MQYVVVPVSGQDLGCVALTALEVGSILLEERPLISVDTAASELDRRWVELAFPADEWETQVERKEFGKLGEAFLALAPGHKARYCKLKSGREQLTVSIELAYGDLQRKHGCLSVSLQQFASIVSIFQINAFRNGLWVELARVNHSCNPNAEVVWDQERGTRKLMVVRRVEEGEEITHCYLHTLLDRDSRRSTLQLRWGFQCRCSLCGLSGSSLAREDAVRAEYCRLEERWKEEGDLPSLEAACSLARTIPGFRHLARLRLLESSFLLAPYPGTGSFQEGYSLACLLLGSASTTAAKWRWRRERPLLSRTVRDMCSLGADLGTAATGIVILVNFCQGEVTLFLVLIVLMTLYSKSR